MPGAGAGGAEVACLFKVPASYVSPLPVCISLECAWASGVYKVPSLCWGRVVLFEAEVRKHSEADGTCFCSERFFSAIYDN